MNVLGTRRKRRKTFKAGFTTARVARTKHSAPNVRVPYDGGQLFSFCDCCQCRIDGVGSTARRVMEPEESIPLAPGAAAALAREALMGQAAPTTRPPGSAAALRSRSASTGFSRRAKKCCQLHSRPGAPRLWLAKYCSRLHHPAPPRVGAGPAQKPRPPPSAPPLPTLPPLQQHWQPPGDHRLRR